MNLEELNKSITPYKVIRRDIINSSLNLSNTNGKYLVFLSPDIHLLYYCKYKGFNYDTMLSELNLFVPTPKSAIEKHQDVLSYKIREYRRNQKIAICIG